MFSLFRKKETNRITGECLQCGRCCQNLILYSKGKPVKTLKSFYALLKKHPFYANFNLIPSKKENSPLHFSCSCLQSNNTCGQYENRPEICRKYPSSSMFIHGGNLLKDCGYRVLSREFHTILEKEKKKKI